MPQKLAEMDASPLGELSISLACCVELLERLCIALLLPSYTALILCLVFLFEESQPVLNQRASAIGWARIERSPKLLFCLIHAPSLVEAHRVREVFFCLRIEPFPSEERSLRLKLLLQLLLELTD